jgi:PTH1 family peptidyl-tRNA hydrolase
LSGQVNPLKIIIGLGNPGSAYSETRHNIGRRLVEAIACRQDLRFSKKKLLKTSLASFHWGNEEVLLAYPESFMNASGIPVALLVKHYGVIPSRDLLIVVDDAALPYGRLRLRGRGSDGGHNGLKSIHECLETQEYARLRTGIQPLPLIEGSVDAQEMGLREFVLSRFTTEEKRTMGAVLDEGFNACMAWILHPIEKAMSVVNPCKK